MSTGQQIWLLSGGIGSGKSTVRQMLAAKGLATIDADSIGQQILAFSGPAEAEVLKIWPEVGGDNGIDRGALGAIVFADREALVRLESITHPHIFQTLKDRVEEATGPTVVEIPLLVQPFVPPLPRMVVDAPDSVRIDRAISRGQSKPDVRNRMANQPTRAEWLAAADLVIPNSGDLGELKSTVDRVAAAIFSL